MTYCSIAQCIRKSFFSIKGIYTQVELMGQQVTWIQPYAFNQRLPFDLDYKVIGTFREFYVALLRFINFKLYSDLGLSYPPKLTGLNDEELYLDTNEIRKYQELAKKKFQN